MRQTHFYIGVGLTFILQLPAFGQSDARLWLKPWAVDEAHVELSADAMIFGEAETDSGADFDLVIYQSRGRARLEPADNNTPQFGYDLIYMDIDTSDSRIPERLMDNSFGIGVHVGEWDGWQFAIVGGGGYAGDEPYSDGEGFYGYGTLMAVKEVDDRTIWQLALNYNGNRTIFPDLPLPAVEYIVKVSDDFTYTVGVPRSSVFWRPREWFYLLAEYYVPTTVNVTATVVPLEHWRIYGGFYNSLNAFQPEANRDGQRIFFIQRRLETGVKWLPCEWFDAFVAGGYAFGQEFSTGWHILDTDGEIEIDDTLYVRFGVGVSF